MLEVPVHECLLEVGIDSPGHLVLLVLHALPVGILWGLIHVIAFLQLKLKEVSILYYNKISIALHLYSPGLSKIEQIHDYHEVCLTASINITALMDKSTSTSYQVHI